MKKEDIEKRKQTKSATIERHKNMTCKTYEVKFDKSHLSKTKKRELYGLFREAKWLYNYVLSQENIFSFKCTKIKEVIVLNKDREKEFRPLNYLSSQMKQSLVQRQKRNIINLSKAKKKGTITYT